MTNTLKTILLVMSIAVMGAFGLPTNDRCNCVPAQSYRIEAKHEQNISAYPLSPITINTSTMLAWETEYASITKSINHSKRSRTLIRQKNCPEDSIYTFVGYLYRIRTGEADCDLHLECGPKNSAQRVGLEITVEKCDLQNTLIAKLKAKGFHISEDNAIGIPFKAKGFGFYDGWHQKWELHPVFEFELLNE